MITIGVIELVSSKWDSKTPPKVGHTNLAPHSKRRESLSPLHPRCNDDEKIDSMFQKISLDIKSLYTNTFLVLTLKFNQSYF